MSGVTTLGLTGSANTITINNTNGNVGIGTTAPTTALQVAGTVTATGYAGLPAATSSAPGVVQPDNITTTMSSGVLAATAPFRNRVINGNMMIDQRGSATTAVTAYAGYGTDRFMLNTNLSSPSSGTVTFGQVATPATLTGFIKCVKLTGSSVAIGGNGYLSITQYIEGLNMADFMWGTSSAQPVTLSFWVYSTATGTYSGGLRNWDSNRSYQTAYTITTANTWQKVVITIPGETSGTWQTDTTGSFQVWLSFGVAGVLLTSSGSWASGNYVGVSGNSALGSNSVYVTGVQLEKGSIATPFEYRPYPVELQLCQRYYEILTGTVYCNSSSGVGTYVYSTSVNYQVTKRVTPTATLWYFTKVGIGNVTAPNIPQISTTCLAFVDNTNTMAGTFFNIGYYISAEL